MLFSRFHLAISVAGAQREQAQQITTCLQRRGWRVFFYEARQSDLVGGHLPGDLEAIYRRRARFCLMLLSAEYISGDWTTYERRLAQDRDRRSRGGFILPVRFDDAVVPGLSDDVAYLDYHKLGASGICDVVHLRCCS